MTALRLISLLFVLFGGAGVMGAFADEPIAIGSRLELFTDEYLIESLTGDARQQLHRPTLQEVSFSTDLPWEGNGVNYITVFEDEGIYRMYYRGVHVDYTPEGYTEPHREVYCYAESENGIYWSKPNLELFEFDGSIDNNIVWDGLSRHNFTPFKDPNPNATEDARYKAIGYGQGDNGKGMYILKSADAIHWEMMSDKPVITLGAFDSQNLAFWDAVRGEYREYHRDFKDGRDIRTCTSKDFITWTEPTFLEYTPGRVSELYTNGIIPYYRAPHIFLGFPTRYIDRGWTPAAKGLPRSEYRELRGAKSPREGTAITDGMFMSSRDAHTFRVWPESFIRPGLRQADTWFYGDCYQNWGLVETASAIDDAPREISIYVTESTLQDRTAYIRRQTIRVDGFVSVSAPLAGGELITKPITFTGNKLMLNYSTSAAGSIRIEVQNDAGEPIEGFTLADSPELYGDSLSQAMLWKEGSDIANLSGQPVRLRIELKDADLYSMQFAE